MKIQCWRNGYRNGTIDTKCDTDVGSHALRMLLKLPSRPSYITLHYSDGSVKSYERKH